MKVYVVGGATRYTRFLDDVTLVPTIDEAELVLFTGGEDVDPSLYGCKKHSSTFSNIKRDQEELAAFEKIKPNQLVLGICRGSQFLCAVNGGQLVQDCDNHALSSTHPIAWVGTPSADHILVEEITSTHHQMQYPYNLPSEHYSLLAVSRTHLSSGYAGDKIIPSEIRSKGEPEVVMYHVPGKPKCLAVQGHPEMIPDSPVAKHLNQIIKENL